MSTRPYIIISLHDDEPVAIVDGTSQAQASRIHAESLFKAKAASGADVLTALQAGVPVIKPSDKAA